MASEQMQRLQSLQQRLAQQKQRLASQEIIRSSSPLQRQQALAKIQSAEQQLQTSEVQLREFEHQQAKTAVTRAAYEKLVKKAQGGRIGSWDSPAEKAEAERLLKEYPELGQAIEKQSIAKTGQLQFLLPKDVQQQFKEAGVNPVITREGVEGYTEGGKKTFFASQNILFTPQGGVSVAPELQQEFVQNLPQQYVTTQGKTYNVLIAGGDTRTATQKRLGELQARRLRGEILTPSEQAEKVILETGKIIGETYGAGKQIITHPIETGKNIFGFVTSPSRIREYGASLGQTFRENPERSAVIIGANVLFPFAVSRASRFISKAAQTGRYETRFLSTFEAAEGDQLFFKSVGTSTQKGKVFPSRTFLFGAESELKPFYTEADAQFFGVGTRGVTYSTTQKLDLITGKLSTKFGKPSAFGALEYSKVTPKELQVLIANNPEIRALVEGGAISSVSKIKTVGGDVSYAITQGYVGELGQGNRFLFTKTRDIVQRGGKFIRLSKGEQDALGIFRRATQPEAQIISGSQQQILGTQRPIIQQAQIRAVEQALRTQPRKASKPISPILAPSTPTTEQEVTTAQPAPSQYAGLGLYEITQEVAATAPPQLNALGLKADILSATASASALASRLAQGLAQRQLEQQRQLERQILEQKIAPAQATVLRNALLERQAQQTRTLQRVIQRQRTAITARAVLRTPLGKMALKPFQSKKEKRTLVEMFTPPEIEGEIRRRGKWIKVVSGLSYDKTLEKLADITDKTLGASFRLKKGKEILPLRNLPYGFRPSKREKGVGVEFRKLRLSTRGETKEIKAAKQSMFKSFKKRQKLNLWR